MTITITELPDRRADEATEVCVRAFGDYPLLRELFPGPPADRAPVSRALYGAIIADALQHGHVSAAFEDERVLGVAVWLPRGAYPTGWGSTRSSTTRPSAAGPRQWSMWREPVPGGAVTD